MKEGDNSLLWVVVILLLLFFGGGIGPVTPTNPPPFVTTLPVASLIVEDTTKRTTELDALFDAVESSVRAGGGQVRRLGTTQTNLSMDEQWVQDAWKVKGATQPWIVAANPTTGVNQALPSDKTAAVKLVQQLGGK